MSPQQLLKYEGYDFAHPTLAGTLRPMVAHEVSLEAMRQAEVRTVLVSVSVSYGGMLCGRGTARGTVEACCCLLALAVPVVLLFILYCGTVLLLLFLVCVFCVCFYVCVCVCGICCPECYARVDAVIALDSFVCMRDAYSTTQGGLGSRCCFVLARLLLTNVQPRDVVLSRMARFPVSCVRRYNS